MALHVLACKALTLIAMMMGAFGSESVFKKAKANWITAPSASANGAKFLAKPARLFTSLFTLEGTSVFSLTSSFPISLMKPLALSVAC